MFSWSWPSFPVDHDHSFHLKLPQNQFGLPGEGLRKSHSSTCVTKATKLCHRFLPQWLPPGRPKPQSEPSSSLRSSNQGAAPRSKADDFKLCIRACGSFELDIFEEKDPVRSSRTDSQKGKFNLVPKRPGLLKGRQKTRAILTIFGPIKEPPFPSSQGGGRVEFDMIYVMVKVLSMNCTKMSSVALILAEIWAEMQGGHWDFRKIESASGGAHVTCTVLKHATLKQGAGPADLLRCPRFWP